MKKLIFICWFLLVHKSGFAQDLLYSNSFNSNSQLFTINEATGQNKLIGSIGFEVTDIAFNDAELYGITFSNFLKINKTTGVGNIIGSLNFSDMNALAVSPKGELFSAGTSSGNFISIDKNTGRGVLIGNYGNGLTSSGDLTFDSDGILYASVKKPGSSTDWIAQINTSTGQASLIGDTGFAKIYGLSFINNVLYGVTANGELLRINQLTGTSSVIGTSNVSYGGLTTKSASNVENCVAEYNNGKLHIPFVTVPDGFGNFIMYDANMDILPFSNPLKFELKNATPRPQ